MEKLISFIVPIYNIEKYVGQCIESLISQDMEQIEIILVDDGSKDASGAICDTYAKKDERIKVIHLENTGVAGARNIGLNSATGKWVCLVDGDDWVSSNLCNSLLPYLDSDFDIIFFGYQHVSEQNKTIYQNDKSMIELDKGDFAQLQVGIFNSNAISEKYDKLPYLTPWGKLFKRTFICENDLQYTLDVKKGQDGLFNIAAYECAQSGKYINEVLYNYRINAESICHRFNPDIEQILEFLIQKYSEFLDIYPKDELINCFDTMKLRQLMYCIILNYCHKDNKNHYKKRKQDFLQALEKETYKNVFNNISINDLKFQEKVLAILIKHRLFMFINLLNKIRTK